MICILNNMKFTVYMAGNWWTVVMHENCIMISVVI